MEQKASRKEASFPFFAEALPDIVRGHEIWVEHGMPNISSGEPVVCDLCFGHNMKSDKAVQVEKVTPAVFSSTGVDYAVELSTAEDHLLIQFTPVFAGYHTIGVEYDGGILNLPHPGLEGPKYYCQYTKTIIPVGNSQAEENSQEEYNPRLGHELEIIPLGYRQYEAGEYILLKVLYDQNALPDATVYGIHTDNREQPLEVRTDQEGMAEIKLEKGGKWMFKVGHRDPEKGVKDLYDTKVMTATFTIMDVGEKRWK